MTRRVDFDDLLIGVVGVIGLVFWIGVILLLVSLP